HVDAFGGRPGQLFGGVVVGLGGFAHEFLDLRGVDRGGLGFVFGQRHVGEAADRVRRSARLFDMTEGHQAPTFSSSADNSATASILAVRYPSGRCSSPSSATAFAGPASSTVCTPAARSVSTAGPASVP